MKKEKKTGRNRIVLAAAAVLWLAVGVQAVMRPLLYREEDIAEAFARINSETMESSLMVLAECTEGFADEEARKQALYALADGIGLTVDGAFTKTAAGERSEIGYEKNGKYARTELKSIRLHGEEENTDYILARLTMYYDTDGILSYRDRIEEICEESGYNRIQSRVTFVGNYSGRLSLGERNRVADRLLETLSGKAAFENRKEEEYTIYAYTAGIREYVLSAGKRINIQIVMEYDPDIDKTRVMVATPVYAGF